MSAMYRGLFSMQQFFILHRAYLATLVVRYARKVILAFIVSTILAIKTSVILRTVSCLKTRRLRDEK